MREKRGEERIKGRWNRGKKERRKEKRTEQREKERKKEKIK